ncbi:MAG: hypothetical protein JW982_09490, partial [Spirochaetes bacterium]|nr:hypothetical protein [Spirochaetota bacterium]
MNFKCKLLILVTFAVLVFQIDLFAEYVFLKNGDIKKGAIVSETASTIVLKAVDKKTYSIERNTILRILYTEIYLGKVFVQKNDGKNVVCYMVDENRETYTFRLELYKPVEFVLTREEVLFIARGNPSGLELINDADYET